MRSCLGPHSCTLMAEISEIPAIEPRGDPDAGPVATGQSVVIEEAQTETSVTPRISSRNRRIPGPDEPVSFLRIWRIGDVERQGAQINLHSFWLLPPTKCSYSWSRHDNKKSRHPEKSYAFPSSHIATLSMSTHSAIPAPLPFVLFPPSLLCSCSFELIQKKNQSPDNVSEEWVLQLLPTHILIISCHATVEYIQGKPMWDLLSS